jgi:hypothetical protein
MKLPAFLAEEAVARLLADHSPAHLRRVLNLLGLDFVEPAPEPDYADLARKAQIEVSENERRGCVSISGVLALLGQSEPINLRYVYVGELDETGFFSSVARLELLVWPADARSPVWTKIDIGVLSRAIVAQIDDLVLAQVHNRTLS